MEGLDLMPALSREEGKDLRRSGRTQIECGLYRQMAEGLGKVGTWEDS